jgi:hypothetical protein
MLGAEGALSCLESFPGPITAATSLAELAAYCGQMRATFESAGRSELALLWGLLQLLCRFDGVLDGSSADENASELLRLLRGSAAAEGAIPSPLATSPASPEAYQLAAHKLESLLLEGQREAACEHAMASGMWADALLISSHMDADTWRAVMTRFANETLAPGSPLKTLYALFAGSGVAAFEAPGSSPGGAAGAATFAPSREASEAAAARTAEHWRSNLAMMLANPTAGDTDVIARLGDQMVVNAEQFAVLVRSRKPGDAVEVTFLRGGKEQKATVTLAGKELPKLGPGGRRMVTGFLAEPTTLGSMDEDVLLVAPGVPGAPGAGPRPRVMTFTPGSRNDADFNVRVDRTRKGAKAGQNVASTTTQVRTMRFSDEEASVEWVVTGDETRFEITDRKGGAGWTGTGKPDEAALATLRPEVAASVRGFLESQSRMQDAIPAVPVPPVPPVPPVAPVAPAPRAISANGA